MSEPLPRQAPPLNSAPPSALDSAVFPMAPAELIEQRGLLARLDRKFLLSTSMLSALLTALARDFLAVGAGKTPIARYTTKYFDTDDLLSLREQRRNVPRRFKVRSRTYVDRKLAFLELKRRTGRGTTAKVRLQRAADADTLSPEEKLFLEPYVPDVPERLRPTVCVKYRRLSLVSPVVDVRLTIDSELHFSPTGADLGGEKQDISVGSVAIAEVKFTERAHARSVIETLLRAGAKESPVSKYCAGMCLLGLAPATGFQEMLRSLQKMVAK